MVKVCEPCKERFRRLRLVQIGEPGQRCEVCEAPIGYPVGEHLAALGADSMSPTRRWRPPTIEAARPEPLELVDSQVRVGEVLDELSSPPTEGRWAPGVRGDVLPDGNTAEPRLAGAQRGPEPLPSVPMGWRWEDDTEPVVSMRSLDEPPPPSAPHKRKRALRIAALGVVALALLLVLGSRTDSPDQLSGSADDKATVKAAAVGAPAKATHSPKQARATKLEAPSQQQAPPAPRPKPPRPRPDRHGFPFEEAKRKLSSAAQRAARCSRPRGVSGPTNVSVRFSPDGRTAPQVFLAPALERTQEGACIKRAMSSVRVRAFHGPPVTLSRRVHLQRR